MRVDTVNHEVLLVLKVPPPFGGGEIMHQIMADALHNRFPMLIFSRRRHSKATQGRLLLSNLLFGIRLMIRVIMRCLKQRPKAVFLWLPKDWPAFVRTALLAGVLDRMGIRVLGDLHGMGFGFLEHARRRDFFLRKIQHFAAIRVLSAGIAEELRRCGYGRRIDVVENGLAVPPYVLETSVHRSLRPLRLLYLGAVSAAKGFDKTIELVNRLEKLGVDWRLSVVGEWVSESFRRKMMPKISDELAGRINFEGLRVAEAKWRLLTHSALLLHFSRWDGQPLTLIEAMAAGVPTVAFPVGAVPEMIVHGDNGFLVTSVDAAADVIYRICQKEIAYEAIAQHARETYARRFTAQRFIAEMERFIVANSHDVAK